MNIAVIQCRVASERLPGKCKLELAGKSILWHVIERTKQLNVDKIIVATTTNEEDLWVVEESTKSGVGSYRGEVENVLSRFFDIVILEKPDYIVRITADNPLFDYKMTNKMLEVKSPYVYMDYPVNGFRSEVIRSSGILFANAKANTAYDKEHVTPILINDESISKLIYPINGLKYLNLTVDTKEDYERMKKIYNALYRGYPILCTEVLRWLSL